MNRRTSSGPAVRLAAMCLLVAGFAAPAGIAATVGLFARGSGAFITFTSIRGEVHDIAMTGEDAWNAQRVVARPVMRATPGEA
jgi:hypothetical protein